MKKTFIFPLLCIVVLSTIFGGGCEADKPWLTNVKIFKDTPAYELAKAVRSENISTIKKICAETPEVMYIHDPYYSYTVLHWAVGMEKYKSVEALLESGMNPNVTTNDWNITPLFIAARYSFVDTQAKNDPKYVKLLIEYGADPNIGTTQVLLPDIIQPNGNVVRQLPLYENGETPLMRTPVSGESQLEKARLLVEEGNANINARTTDGFTAAQGALIIEDIELAHYLIVEKKADITNPYTNYISSREGEFFYAVYYLRFLIYDLESKEYELKLEIIEEFARQGVDYWSEPIPKRILSQIKKRYPDTWEEYIKVY